MTQKKEAAGCEGRFNHSPMKTPGNPLTGHFDPDQVSNIPITEEDEADEGVEVAGRFKPFSAKRKLSSLEGMGDGTESSDAKRANASRET